MIILPDQKLGVVMLANSLEAEESGTPIETAKQKWIHRDRSSVLLDQNCILAAHHMAAGPPNQLRKSIGS